MQLRILVVEDHDDTRHSLGMMLEILGHLPDLAGDGEQALDLARLKRFDALVTDVHMPRMDGWALVRELKTRMHLPARVISMSAGMLATETARSLDAGCHAHLQKPFTPEEIEAALVVVATQ